jgi:hypothetical protein
MTLRKCGGIWFWRVGRVGGSFYLKQSKGKSPMLTVLLGGVAVVGILAFLIVVSDVGY